MLPTRRCLLQVLAEDDCVRLRPKAAAVSTSARRDYDAAGADQDVPGLPGGPAQAGKEASSEHAVQPQAAAQPALAAAVAGQEAHGAQNAGAGAASPQEPMRKREPLTFTLPASEPTAAVAQGPAPGPPLAITYADASQQGQGSGLRAGGHVSELAAAILAAGVLLRVRADEGVACSGSCDDAMLRSSQARLCRLLAEELGLARDDDASDAAGVQGGGGMHNRAAGALPDTVRQPHTLKTSACIPSRILICRVA